jgi:hypothetical protein
MSNKIIWQQGSNNPNNQLNFDQIGNWWRDLRGKKITFAQRIIPSNKNINDIDWEEKRFDETFILTSSDIRGITLYWQKIEDKEERNLTASKLELDLDQQQLYIYSASQKQVIIRVNIPQIKYQLIDLNNPQIAANMQGENCILLLQDQQKKIEVKINLSPEKITDLLKILSNK